MALQGRRTILFIELSVYELISYNILFTLITRAKEKEKIEESSNLMNFRFGLFGDT